MSFSRNWLPACARAARPEVRGETAPVRKLGVEGPDIKRIRTNYKLSQGQFATLLGISTATLQNWEQGRRMPEGAARVLLQVAAKHPDAVWDVVNPVVGQSRTRAGTRIARAARSSKALKV